jgi:hypothetical protein
LLVQHSAKSFEISVLGQFDVLVFKTSILKENLALRTWISSSAFLSSCCARPFAVLCSFWFVAILDLLILLLSVQIFACSVVCLQ